jgi:protease IV
MTQSPPPGQGPVDPSGAFSMPPAPGGGSQRPSWGAPPLPPMPPPGQGSGQGFGSGFPPGNYQQMMPPRRPGRRRLLIGLLIGFIAGVAVVRIFSSALLTSGVSETILQPGDESNKVAVVPVDGMILDNSAADFDRILTSVERDTSVKSLVVEIDTPGGSASASDEMYHRLMRFKSLKRIPVFISMKGMATSGGYYLSCAGDTLFAEPITLTGNIGVLLPRFNLYKFIDDHGIQETTLTATVQGHSFKNAGSMFQPENALDEQYIQGLIDGLFGQFKNAVQTGRSGKLHDAAGDIFSGKAFIAADALTRGLIDQIGYPEQAYAAAGTAAGLTNPAVVRYTRRVSVLDSLTGGDSDSVLKIGGVKADGSVNDIDLNAKSIEELICARPLMLWRAN